MPEAAIIAPPLTSCAFETLTNYISLPPQGYGVVHEAFSVASCAERDAVSLYTTSPNTLAEKERRGKSVKYARVVGFLLVEFFNKRLTLTDHPVRMLAEHITACARASNHPSNGVYQLGEFLTNTFLRGFRTVTKRYPDIPRNYPTQWEAADVLNRFGWYDFPVSSPDYKKAKDMLFIRTGNRCMVTGVIHKPGKDTQVSYVPVAGSVRGPVDVAHIVNESFLMDDVDAIENKRDTTSMFLTILSIFGGEHFMPRIVDLVHGTAGIHGLQNLLSLRSDLHRMFDTFLFWFEPTGQLNKYTLHFVESDARPVFGNFPDFVTFSVNPHTHIPAADLPLPDPFLVTLHGVCARVAHLSGAAAIFKDWDNNDGDMMPVLSTEEMPEITIHPSTSSLLTVPA